MIANLAAGKQVTNGNPTMFLRPDKLSLPGADNALPGRDTPMPITEPHVVNGQSLLPPFPPHSEQLVFCMGCFWGAEKRFWEQEGVIVTAVGYAAGITPNPTYHEVCTGMTGHNEVVRVVFDPAGVSVETLLERFWESHDPTQGMRQGNDIGTQYRSGIYTTTPAQREAALRSRDHFQARLHAGGLGDITTEICDAPVFYYAEQYHQQYLARNPAGYCGLGGPGVSFHP